MHDFTWTADPRYQVYRQTFHFQDWAERFPEEVEKAHFRATGIDLDLYEQLATRRPAWLSDVESRFVADGVEWAHIDVAAPAYNTGGPWGYNGKGGTGVPTRTMFGVLEDIAANG